MYLVQWLRVPTALTEELVYFLHPFVSLQKPVIPATRNLIWPLVSTESIMYVIHIDCLKITHASK